MVRWIDHFDFDRAGQTDLTWDQSGRVRRALVSLALRTNTGVVLPDDALLSVAVHETGHAIGLPHSADSNDVMFPATRTGVLSDRDRRTVEALYRLPPGPVSEFPRPPVASGRFERATPGRRCTRMRRWRGRGRHDDGRDARRCRVRPRPILHHGRRRGPGRHPGGTLSGRRGDHRPAGLDPLRPWLRPLHLEPVLAGAGSRLHLWDIASITKVVRTAASAMRMVDQGKLDLDAPVRRYLPRFSGGLKNQVTVRMLLDHTSGLKSYVPIYRKARGSRSRMIDLLYAQPLVRAPGDSAEYSDLNAMLLGLVVEKVGGASLDQLAAARGLRSARA